MRGPEVEKSHHKRIESKFYEKYMSGCGVDIGYRGEIPDAIPVLVTAEGFELGMGNYDGVNLPYPDNALDYVFSSHCLEHISEPEKNLKEWLRVLKFGGHLVIMVPHKYLYEKKDSLPSRWNEDHKVFYTPGSLLTFIENVFQPNTYRVVHCIDNDEGYSYEIPPEKHAGGAYEIELVLKKIVRPAWGIE